MRLCGAQKLRLKAAAATCAMCSSSRRGCLGCQSVFTASLLPGVCQMFTAIDHFMVSC